MKKIMFNDRFCLTQAVLEGRKTMTRRIIQAPKNWHGLDVYGFSVNKDNRGNVKDISLVGSDGGSLEDENGSLGMILPKYQIGEVVAVAQSYKDAKVDPFFLLSPLGDGVNAMDSNGWDNKMFTRPEMMPHKIRITDIKVERLQDISEDDCLKEGVGRCKEQHVIGHPFGVSFNYYIKEDSKGNRYSTPREAFANLIDKVSGKGTWDSNPYVVAYSFELVQYNKGARND